MKSIIIFGGSGYVGKNLIRRFAKEGYKVIVPYQKHLVNGIGCDKIVPSYT